MIHSFPKTQNHSGLMPFMVKIWAGIWHSWRIWSGRAEGMELWHEFLEFSLFILLFSVKCKYYAIFFSNDILVSTQILLFIIPSFLMKVKFYVGSCRDCCFSKYPSTWILILILILIIVIIICNFGVRFIGGLWEVLAALPA